MPCLLPRSLAPVFVFALAAAHAVAQTKQEGAVTLTRSSSPEKRLDFEVNVPAPPAAVWEALSTSKGLSTWLWRDAVVDLRVGGDWLVNFPGGSTGGGTITAFVPGKSIEIAALAPEQFPTVRRERTHAVFEIKGTEDGKSTIVHLTQTGWKSGEEWDKAYDYLSEGNAELLSNLRQRFVSGPFDWDALMKGTPPAHKASNVSDAHCPFHVLRPVAVADIAVAVA
jgi:uncharacterized protein YndB with AHSA1/START domain